MLTNDHNSLEVALAVPPNPYLGVWDSVLAGPFVGRVRPDRPPVQVGRAQNASGELLEAFALPCWRSGWHWTLISREDSWALGCNWFVASTGYVVRNFDNRQQLMHRLVAWCRHKGASEPDRYLYLKSALQVDHGDRVRTNNHRSNLELVDQALNNLNQRPRVDDGREVTGVTWDNDRNKWMAYTSYRGKRIWVGRFVGQHQAEHAVERKREQLERRHRARISKQVNACIGFEEVPF